MRKTKLYLIVFVVLLFTGCFEDHGKVYITADKKNTTFSIDGKKVNTSKPIELIVGKYTLKAVSPIDNFWQYVGKKEFEVNKDKTIDIKVKTFKEPTKKRIEYLSNLKNFNPNTYKFKWYDKNTSHEIQVLKAKVNNYINNNQYNLINPKDIIIAKYNNKLKMIKQDIDKTIKDSIQLVSTLENSKPVYDVAIKDGYIISGSGDKTIKIYELKTGKLIKILRGHKKEVTSIIVKDNYIISSSNVNIKIWSLKTGKLIRTIRLSKCQFCSNKIDIYKNYIFNSLGNTVKIWSLKTGKLIKTLKTKARSIDDVKVNKDYIVVALYNKINHYIQVWSMKTKKLLYTINYNDSIRTLAILDNYILSSSLNNDMKVWSLKNGKFIKTLDKYGKDAMSIATQDNYIVSATYNHNIEIASLKNNTLIKIKKGHKSTVSSIAIKGNYIVSGSWDNTIKIWKLKMSLKKLEKLKSIQNQLNNLLNKIDLYSIKQKELNIKYEMVYKYGKIGEIYVPSVSWSSSTPNTSHTYINGRSYTSTTYTHSSGTNSGYSTTRQGYKAINRITNNSDKYYLLKIKSSWKGKYTTVGTSSSWGGDERRVWGEKYQDGYKYNTFIIPPNKSIKYQFEVGEEKSPVKTQILSAYIVPKEYADKLFEALDEKNEAIILINKFLNEKRIEAWHDRLNNLKTKIIKKVHQEFNKRYVHDVEVSMLLSKDYDADFGGDVTITVKVPTLMCVYLNTPFGNKKIYFMTKGSKSIVYHKIKGLNKSSKLKIIKVTPEIEIIDAEDEDW